MLPRGAGAIPVNKFPTSALICPGNNVTVPHEAKKRGCGLRVCVNRLRHPS
jgi:hypothetical protein